MKTKLVIGANRGIGLEIAKQFSSEGHQVIATSRKECKELEGLSNTKVITGVDTTDVESLTKLASQLDQPVDELWVVAGILERNSLDNLDTPSIKKQFEVNAVGPLQAVQSLQGKVKEMGKVALLSSRMGSIADNTSGGMYGYRMSKAALNMAGQSLSHDLKDKKIAVALLHPGYVKTDMTGHSGNIDAKESAAGMIKQMESVSLENSGVFVHQSGEKLPW